MSSARIQKLNALLKRVAERGAQPRLVPSLASQARAPVAAPAPSPAPEPELFAATLPPDAPTIAPAATLPPAPAVRSAANLGPEPSPEPARRAPSSSPLEDAMAQLGAGREDSGPLQLEVPAMTIQPRARPSLVDPDMNQDLVLTHRPEAGPGYQGPIVELVQPKAPGLREPTIQFDTGVKANPLTQRDLKPAGLVEPPSPPVEVTPVGPTQKLEPAPLAAHASPAQVVSSARIEAAKTFGELLELSLALRPTSAR